MATLPIGTSLDDALLQNLPNISKDVIGNITNAAAVYGWNTIGDLTNADPRKFNQFLSVNAKLINKPIADVIKKWRPTIIARPRPSSSMINASPLLLSASVTAIPITAGHETKQATDTQQQQQRPSRKRLGESIYGSGSNTASNRGGGGGDAALPVAPPPTTITTTPSARKKPRVGLYRGLMSSVPEENERKTVAAATAAATAEPRINQATRTTGAVHSSDLVVSPPQAPQIHYVVGPIRLAEYVGLGKQIYLIGDKHVKESSCPAGALPLINFIEQMFADAKGQTVDFFLETDFVPTERSTHDQRLREIALATARSRGAGDAELEQSASNYLRQVLDRFRGCLRKSKSLVDCPWLAQVRFHYADIRNMAMLNESLGNQPNLDALESSTDLSDMMVGFFNIGGLLQSQEELLQRLEEEGGQEDEEEKKRFEKT